MDFKMNKREDLRIVERPIRFVRHPFSSFSNLMDVVFDNFMTESTGENESYITPKIDIIEQDNKFIVETELPGIEKKDLNIEVGDDYLSIKGEKKLTEEKKEQNYYFRETRYGKFSREIPLPNKINTTEVKAFLENGILKIELPKIEETKTRKIELI